MVNVGNELGIWRWWFSFGYSFDQSLEVVARIGKSGLIWMDTSNANFHFYIHVVYSRRIVWVDIGILRCRYLSKFIVWDHCQVDRQNSDSILFGAFDLVVYLFKHAIARCHADKDELASQCCVPNASAFTCVLPSSS